MKLTFLIAYLFLVTLMGVEEASAQHVYRIGALLGEEQFVPALEGFKKKMAELGYIEGKNVSYQVY
ncbi:MAG: hypothetical protein AAB279_00805, partial [Candidatus Binatota bacterium]